MDTPALRVLSLFTGIGGLDLGLSIALESRGFRHSTVCYVEREAYPAAVLVARMEESSLDRAPIWSDVATFDGGPWRGAVDIVVGGFPCQDISVAGSKRGLAGKRSGLFYEMLRVVDETEPQAVFLENVANITANGVREEVLSELESRGYEVEDGVLSAEDIGAPHGRKRWFGVALAYGSVLRLSGVGSRDHNNRSDATGDQPDRRHPRFRSWPPRPDDSLRWAEELRDNPRESPALPSFRREADGFPDWLVESGRYRADRLYALGNAVVPAQAAEAYNALLARFEEGP